MKIFILLAIIIFNTIQATAQAPSLDKGKREATIKKVVELLKEKYAYPEIASRMEADLAMRQKRGDYEGLTDGTLFAERITADLRALFNDKHLKLSYSETPIRERSARAGEPTEAEIEAAKRRQSRENFGVLKAEILKGNVGYIQINYFAPLSWASDTYSATFNYVANTDALLIDVRQNSGSMDINTIPFFCSYLFDAPVIIGDITSRDSQESRQLWTYAKVPGSKYLGKPVFVLTSARTASGAEGFVSALKRFKRATLIGQTTAGATMPGMSHRVNENFSIWISTGRSTSGNADTENKGVVPDLEVDASNAITVAHSKALEQLAATTVDDAWKAELERLRSGLAGR